MLARLLVLIMVFAMSSCQIIKFFASDENCTEKVKEAATCGALVEKNYENCRNVATEVAVAETNATGSVVLPDFAKCDSDRGLLQGVCWYTVREKCL